MGVYGNNDRLNAMLFVAALFHGVLILGVGFSDGELFSTGTPSTSMEVVLLARDFDEQPDSNDAEYLAQQNLAGTGNTTEDQGLRVAYGRDANPVMPGPERDGADTLQQQEQRFESTEERLYARRADADRLSAERQQINEELHLRTGMAGAANSLEILATPDERTVLQGAHPRELIVSANTRESRIATYLDSWKRRIERVGTENFPRVAANRAAASNPVLEVSVLADGTLQEAIILRSSGNRELDQAAIDILKVSGRFDPFPDYLRNDYDALKFSYEWQFNSGSVGTMRAR